MPVIENDHDFLTKIVGNADCEYTIHDPESAHVTWTARDRLYRVDADVAWGGKVAWLVTRPDAAATIEIEFGELVPVDLELVRHVANDHAAAVERILNDNSAKGVTIVRTVGSFHATYRAIDFDRVRPIQGESDVNQRGSIVELMWEPVVKFSIVAWSVRVMRSAIDEIARRVVELAAHHAPYDRR